MICGKVGDKEMLVAIFRTWVNKLDDIQRYNARTKEIANSRSIAQRGAAPKRVSGHFYVMFELVCDSVCGYRFNVFRIVTSVRNESLRSTIQPVPSLL